MAVFFFNTLTRRKEEFKPVLPPQVKLYTCGPTVYDFPHIGNFRTYVFEDLLRRWLKLSGYQVTQVMNLTDVDDKTIRGAIQNKTSLSSYTKTYIDYFFQDLTSLNIQSVEHYPKATEHIAEMVEIIADLLKKKIAYSGEDGSIYYDISKFSHYGELAHIQVEELKPGARVSHDEYDKAQASDFALWKAWDAKDGDVYWETKLGKGRPGWHIECSAMSMKYLGSHFDIHTGGVDNIFPHHQNEIAQSEAYSGERFVNYWLHAEHLLVDGHKMSKSLGNFYTVREVLSQGYSPPALRYFYVSSHYRNKLNFTFPGLQGAQSALTRIEDFLRRVQDQDSKTPAGILERVQRAKQDFCEGMNDDLNTPRAVASLHDLMNELNTSLEDRRISKAEGQMILDLFLWADELLGLGLQRTTKQQKLPHELASLVALREEARKTKNFKKADEIRKTLEEKGLVIEDTPSGPRWKMLSSEARINQE